MPEPTEPLRCAYLTLVEVLAAIDKTDVPDDLPACHDEALFVTYVMRKRAGQDIEIYTQTCDRCDHRVHATPGYIRSVHLRRPKPTT